MVHPQRTDIAQRVGDIDHHIAVALQQRDQVRDRLLPPVNLAVLQCRRCACRVRHDPPLDPVKHHALAAGQPVRSFRPGHVTIELFEHRERTRHPFRYRKFHRAGADDLGNRLERIGFGDPLRHNAGDRRIGFAERQQHLRERLVQPKTKRAIVQSLQRVQTRFDHLAHGVARHPASEAGNHVARQNRLAVVKLQPCTKLEGPGPAVIGDLMALRHLRLRVELTVDAVQRVPNEQRGIADHVLGAPDRVEIGEVRLGDELQQLGAGGCCEGRGGQSAGGRHGGGRALQKVTTVHCRRTPCRSPNTLQTSLDGSQCC